MKFSTCIPLLTAILVMAGGSRAGAADASTPTTLTARDFYNVGTVLLNEKKFTEAETMFESALGSQEEAVQPPALYNLGHVRFDEGVDLLKKGPDAQKAMEQGTSALAAGDHAIQSAEGALAQNDTSRMVAAYLEGRGARHEMRAAQQAVEDAMGVFGNTLRKWQRADDDFKSAAELNPSDTAAAHNAQVVENGLAQLIDMIRKMQEMAGALAGKRNELGKQMSKLKGQMPGLHAPPGAAGEDDDDEDQKNGLKPDSLVGQKENAVHQTGESPIQMSPDQAAQTLRGLSLDSSKRLPMEGIKEGKAADRNNPRNW
jgi:tetratricopeptide (TPR) repeat protein